MSEYLIQSETLDAIADAINAKTGGSSPMTPAEMVTEIGSIETGGGGDYVADDWLNLAKPEGNIVSAVRPSQYSHYYIIRGRTKINSVFLTDATVLSDSMFGYSKIKYFVGPKVASIYSSCFSYSYDLLAVDILAGLQASVRQFFSCNNLKTLVLRSTTLSALDSVNAFGETPFASGKAGGTLYVPQALVASYQSATNWSTILGYPNNQILPIEGSIYETQYADGTPIPTE